MKKRVYSMLAGLFLYMMTMTAQEAPSGLTNAFKKGSAQGLVSYFDNKVELVLTSGSKEYDRTGAQQTLNDFFTNNKVNSFTVNHQGGRDGSSFIIGTLSTSGGNYRVNCFFKKNENQYLIQQIRIEKTNE